MTYDELIENYRFELVSENRLAECEPLSPKQLIETM